MIRQSMSVSCKVETVEKEKAKTGGSEFRWRPVNVRSSKMRGINENAGMGIGHGHDNFLESDDRQCPT